MRIKTVHILLKKLTILTACLLLMAMLTACSAFFSSAASRMAGNFSYAFENQRDMEVAKEATPAYLLMLDALIKDAPKNVSLLKTAARLNAAYADIFVKDSERSKALTAKAMDLALKAACIQDKRLCDIRGKTYNEFEKIIYASTNTQIDTLYTLGSVWASWIQANPDDWNAIAELPKVEAVMRKVIMLNPAHEDGEAFLYLGTMATLLPPALGGQPEKGRQYFEKAIELSREKNLYAKVLYAQRYARLIFDQQLHDRLLNEVLSTDPHIEGYTLINIIAHKEAKRLLDTSKDYF